MPIYHNGINLRSVSLGLNCGRALTTGEGNTLVGAEAGSALTTGSRNTILGSYSAAAEPTVTGNVILAAGTAGGTPVCRWDASGNMQFRVSPTTEVADPVDNNAVRVAYDPTTNAIVHKVRYNGATYVSRSATKQSVEALGITAADSAKLGGLTAARPVPPWRRAGTAHSTH